MFSLFQRRDWKEFGFGQKPSLPHDAIGEEFDALVHGDSVVIGAFLERRLAKITSPDLSSLRDLLSDYSMKCMCQWHRMVMAVAAPNTPPSPGDWDDGCISFLDQADAVVESPFEGFQSQWDLLIEFFHVMSRIRIGGGTGTGFVWEELENASPWQAQFHGLIKFGRIVPLYWDVSGNGIAMVPGGRVYLNYVGAGPEDDRSVRQVACGLSEFVEQLVDAIKTRGVLWMEYYDE